MPSSVGLREGKGPTMLVPADNTAASATGPLTPGTVYRRDVGRPIPGWQGRRWSVPGTVLIREELTGSKVVSATMPWRASRHRVRLVHPAARPARVVSRHAK